jgi:hypothetical protein
MTNLGEVHVPDQKSPVEAEVRVVHAHPNAMPSTTIDMGGAHAAPPIPVSRKDFKSFQLRALVCLFVILALGIGTPVAITVESVDPTLDATEARDLNGTR